MVGLGQYQGTKLVPSTNLTSGGRLFLGVNVAAERNFEDSFLVLQGVQFCGRGFQSLR